MAAVTTLAEEDVIPPRITGPPVVLSVTDQQATVLWETDEPSDSFVEWGADTTYGFSRTVGGRAGDVAGHKVTLTNLQPMTQYHFRVGSTDLSNNGPTFSRDTTFTTSADPDLSPPEVTEVPAARGVTNRSAVIAWGTDELSDSFVHFGVAGTAKRTATGQVEFESTTGSTDDVTDHGVTLTNLEPGTTYEYQAGSIDQSGNESLASIGTFTTAAEADGAVADGRILRCAFVHSPDPVYADFQNYGTKFMPVWAYTLAAHVPDGGPDPSFYVERGQ